MNKSTIILTMMLISMVLPYAVIAEDNWVQFGHFDGKGTTSGHSPAFHTDVDNWRVRWECNLTRSDQFFDVSAYSYEPTKLLKNEIVRVNETNSRIWNMTEYGAGDYYVTVQGRTNWFKIYLEYKEDNIPEFPTWSIALMFIGLCGSAIVIKKKMHP